MCLPLEKKHWKYYAQIGFVSYLWQKLLYIFCTNRMGVTLKKKRCAVFDNSAPFFLQCEWTFIDFKHRFLHATLAALCQILV